MQSVGHKTVFRGGLRFDLLVPDVAGIAKYI